MLHSPEELIHANIAVAIQVQIVKQCTKFRWACLEESVLGDEDAELVESDGVVVRVCCSVHRGHVSKRSPHALRLSVLFLDIDTFPFSFVRVWDVDGVWLSETMCGRRHYLRVWAMSARDVESNKPQVIQRSRGLSEVQN